MDILIRKDTFKEEDEIKHSNLIVYCCPCCGSEDIYRCESDYGEYDCDGKFQTVTYKYEWVPYICKSCKSEFAAIDKSLYRFNKMAICSFITTFLSPFVAFGLKKWWDLRLSSTPEMDSNVEKAIWACILAVFICFGVLMACTAGVIFFQSLFGGKNRGLDPGPQYILDTRVRISYEEHQKCDGNLVENEKFGLLSPEVDKLVGIENILRYKGVLLR